jgi:hypothetical protein
LANAITYILRQPSYIAQQVVALYVLTIPLGLRP